MANSTNSLSHTKGLCKYHIVIVPKYRRKIIYTQIAIATCNSSQKSNDLQQNDVGLRGEGEARAEKSNIGAGDFPSLMRHK